MVCASKDIFDRFHYGSSDEISQIFIKDLHLSKECEKILLLKYCHHLLEKQIADLVHLDIRTVQQRLADARYEAELRIMARWLEKYRLELREHETEIMSIDDILNS